jgi:hypothetical protein
MRRQLNLFGVNSMMTGLLFRCVLGASMSAQTTPQPTAHQPGNQSARKKVQSPARHASGKRAGASKVKPAAVAPTPPPTEKATTPDPCEGKRVYAVIVEGSVSKDSRIDAIQDDRPCAGGILINGKPAGKHFPPKDN